MDKRIEGGQPERLATSNQFERAGLAIVPAAATIAARAIFASAVARAISAGAIFAATAVVAAALSAGTAVSAAGAVFAAAAIFAGTFSAVAAAAILAARVFNTIFDLRIASIGMVHDFGRDMMMAVMLGSRFCYRSIEGQGYYREQGQESPT